MTDAAEPGRGALDRALRLYLDVSKRAVIAVSVAVLALMVALNGLEIAGRGLFGRSFTWIQEVSILAAMWIYFFAYALIAKDEEYIRVDFVADRVGAAARRWMALFARLATIAFHGLVLWFAFETWRFLGLFRTSVLEWPESLFVLPILVGAADILATELIHLRRVLRDGEQPPRPPEIVQEAD
jgi:TRAP-type C4-dicarboxylate transport system permease small subunit